eukprot:3013537-Pyramimonas_sp.AAC.2
MFAPHCPIAIVASHCAHTAKQVRATTFGIGKFGEFPSPLQQPAWGLFELSSRRGPFSEKWARVLSELGLLACQRRR